MDIRVRRGGSGWVPVHYTYIGGRCGGEWSWEVSVKSCRSSRSVGSNIRKRWILGEAGGYLYLIMEGGSFAVVVGGVDFIEVWT